MPEISFKKQIVLDVTVKAVYAAKPGAKPHWLDVKAVTTEDGTDVKDWLPVFNQYELANEASAAAELDARKVVDYREGRP